MTVPLLGTCLAGNAAEGQCSSSIGSPKHVPAGVSSVLEVHCRSYLTSVPVFRLSCFFSSSVQDEEAVQLYAGNNGSSSGGRFKSVLQLKELHLHISNEQNVYSPALYGSFDFFIFFSFSREKPPAVAGSREPRVSLDNLSVKGTHVPIKSSKK